MLADAVCLFHSTLHTLDVRVSLCSLALAASIHYSNIFDWRTLGNNYAHYPTIFELILHDTSVRQRLTSATLKSLSSEQEQNSTVRKEGRKERRTGLCLLSCCSHQRQHTTQRIDCRLPTHTIHATYRFFRKSPSTSPSQQTHSDIMRIATSTLALLALPAIIHAEKVSLIDFVPRVDGVSGACDKVYKQAVTGCDSQDFKQKSCSVTCVKALASMTTLVKDSCSDEGFLDSSNKNSNILALFLQDRGPQNLCSNANEVLQSQSSLSAATTKHSSTAENTQASTTAVVSSVSTASSTDVPTSLLVDSSSSPGSTSTTSSTESAESSQSTSSGASSETSQIFEAPSMPASWTATSASSQPTESSEHSGGGSPFDVAAAQFVSSAAATSSSAVLLIIAITLTLFAAQR